MRDSPAHIDKMGAFLYWGGVCVCVCVCEGGGASVPQCLASPPRDLQGPYRRPGLTEGLKTWDHLVVYWRYAKTLTFAHIDKMGAFLYRGATVSVMAWSQFTFTTLSERVY
ncbi:hypothetical protein PoB_005281700 [Plakobranchus ocellatus]|uniref:Uncharacterized protein n=1 Tax=Plakobranchus ocellatus TaxID=259542 RepID=A0AAV4C4T6_9GAST|nr:hypothetical protein PoB_005281700 [Plakobranchus ocellatus]